MMRGSLCFLFLVATIALPVKKCWPLQQSQPGEITGESPRLCIAFYNVENLFDCFDDPGVEDEEFTPDGSQHWTSEKYQRKISNIARVIRALNDGKGADIIGLAEIENEKVLHDLISDPQIKNLNYGIVHHDSPDKRGIDVAMIYKRKVFKVIASEYYRVNGKQFDDHPTRDIVMVQGIVEGKDTVEFFLNHWPSRRAGKQASEPRRIAAAKILKNVLDSITLRRPNSKLIILGDFNDNPTDPSIQQILHATNLPGSSASDLYNGDFNFDWRKGEGTEYYHGTWSRFIQIIVSFSVIRGQLNTDGTFSDIHIFKPDWLLMQGHDGHEMIPRRTTENGSTQIGFSDHLPVYMELKF